jgi:hypothetical protein
MKKEAARKNGISLLKTYITSATGIYEIYNHQDIALIVPSYFSMWQNEAEEILISMYIMRPMALFPKSKFMYGDMDFYLSERIYDYKSFTRKNYKILDTQRKLSINPVKIDKKDPAAELFGSIYEIKEIKAGKDSIKLEPYESCTFDREKNDITTIEIYDMAEYLSQFGRVIKTLEVLV